MGFNFWEYFLNLKLDGQKNTQNFNIMTLKKKKKTKNWPTSLKTYVNGKY